MGGTATTKKKSTWLMRRLVFKPTAANLLLMIVMIGVNLGGHYLADALKLPVWLDTIGTMVVAILLGAMAGAIVGGLSVLIMGLIDGFSLIFVPIGLLVGILVGFFYPREEGKQPGSVREENGRLLTTVSVAILVALLSSLLCIPLNMKLNGGYTGNLWGDALYDMLSRNMDSPLLNAFMAEIFVDIPDRVISLGIAIFLTKFLKLFTKKSKKPSAARTAAKGMVVLLLLSYGALSLRPMAVRADGAVEEPDYDADYETVVYNKESGMLASEVNAVAQTRDGYLWIGTYSGLYMYDGVRFNEMHIEEHIRNVMCLFVDSGGRLWIGTNDCGVVCYDTYSGETMHFSTENGLSADSVRTIGEDSNGNIYLGTVQHVSMVNTEGKLRTYNAWETILYAVDFQNLGDGLVGGVTNDGTVFLTRDGKLLATKRYEKDEDIQFRKLCFLPDNVVMVGTTSEELELFRLDGEDLVPLKTVSMGELGYVNDLLYSEKMGGVFLCCENGMGFYVSSTGKVKDMTRSNFRGAVGDVCVDEQGNIWFASNKYGLLKYSRTLFRNIFQKTNLPQGAVNAQWLAGTELYIGMDKGVRIIDIETQKEVKKSWQDTLAEDRIRNIIMDSKGNLWISMFGQSGVVRIGPDQKLTDVDAENDFFLGGKGRSVMELSDGRIMIAGRIGLFLYEDGKISRRIGVGTGLENQTVLSMVQMESGAVLASTDGDGVYEIENDIVVRHIGREDGLESGVVMRIVPCAGGFIYVSSNALYYDNTKQVRRLENFPYSNNYDVMITGDRTCWVTSSAGLYKVKEADLLGDEKDYAYTLLNTNWGLTTSFTANSWSVVNGAELFLCCTDGVRSFRSDGYDTINSSFQMHLVKAVIDNEEIPVQNGRLVIPAKDGRIQFYIAVNNYTLSNPRVKAYLEGAGDEGLECYQNEITPLIYTNLPYGEYTLHIRVSDSVSGQSMSAEIPVEKTAMRYEYLSFRVYLFIVSALFVMYVFFLFREFARRAARISGLQKEMSTDPMTGLLNKSGSEKALRACCEQQTGILMMIDLDSFKLVNDLYGHDMGDRILIRFAELIRESTHEGDVTGRLGGDEFVAFMKDTLDRDEVERVTRQLNREIVKSAKEYMGEDMNIPLGASIGAVRVPQEGRDFEKVFKLADMELYIVKKNGKHGFSLYEQKTKDAGAEEEHADKNSLEQMRKILGERNVGQGAYLLNFERLQVLYKFLNRNDQETSTVTGFVRLVPRREDGEAVSDELRDSLEEALIAGLRKNDVVCRYAGSFFLLLTGCAVDEAEGMARKLAESWQADGGHEGITFDFEVETVG